MTALSLVDVAAGPITSGPAPELGVDFSYEWRSVLEADLDDEGLHELHELQRMGLPAPTIGAEIDGIPILASWPQDMVLLDHHLGPDEQETARGQGWAVLASDTEALRSALTKEN